TDVFDDRNWFHLAGPLHGLDVGGARALGALLDLVLHLVVLLQRLEPARLDGREVHEEILAAVIGRDEAEALGVVEPLYGTGTHVRSEEHTSELQSRGHLVCRLLLEKKNKYSITTSPRSHRRI